MGKNNPQRRKKNLIHFHNSNINERRSKLNSGIANPQKFSVLEEISTSLYTVDRFSSLPNDVLLHIISFLPFHSALNTRVLSTYWNELWLSNATLTKHGYQADIAPAITEFLNHCNDLDSLKKLQRLEFKFCKYQILLVSVGLNSKLHLDFSKIKKNVLGEFWWLQSWGDPRSFIHNLSPSLKFVKSLKLTSVNYYHTSDIVTCITNLELLESLVIQRCNEVRNLCIKDVRKLKNLVVLDCPQLTQVNIEARELRFLRIRGNHCMRFQGDFSLEDAMVDIRGHVGYYFLLPWVEWFNSFLQKIRLVKNLTLCRWTLEIMDKKWLNHVQFRCLTDLWWIDSSVEEQNIDALLSFLKFCPCLERLFITIDPRSYGMRSTVGKSPSNARHYSKQGRLKVVKVENLIDGEGVIFLAEALLEAFDVKKLVVVASDDGKYLRNLVRIPVRRAAQKGECYKFVEAFGDEKGLRLKHAHMGL